MDVCAAVCVEVNLSLVHSRAKGVALAKYGVCRTFPIYFFSHHTRIIQLGDQLIVALNESKLEISLSIVTRYKYTPSVSKYESS